MANPIKLWQGADRDIICTHDEPTLTGATEIEVVIDSPSQITKSLTGGGVLAVTTSSFTIAISDTDTVDTPSGEYEIDCRATIGGVITHGLMNPRKVRIIDSKFSNTE
jgi:hypothetical protein